MTKNIMVVDDAVFMRKILKDYLQKAGYNVVAEVDNGKKAVDRYKEFFGTPNRIDAVIMDITMPEMDGITALKKIIEFDSDAVVVMCSSLTSQQSVVAAVQLGAKHFIKKPFAEDQVISIVQKVLA